MSEIRWIYTTWPPGEAADEAAEALVSERLAACANILPGMRSVYRWDGKVERGQEQVMILKTTPARLSALRDRLIALHPFDEPCFLALGAEAEGAAAGFAEWVARSVAPDI